MLSTALVVKFAQEAINQNDGSMSTALLIVGSFILFRASAFKIFFVDLISLASYLLRISVTYGEKFGKESPIIILSYTVLLSGIFLSCALLAFSFEITKRQEFV